MVTKYSVKSTGTVIFYLLTLVAALLFGWLLGQRGFIPTLLEEGREVVGREHVGHGLLLIRGAGVVSLAYFVAYA